ncbi:hypothetical protein HanRHA438_Chr00c42g0857131 [Helianthus annuus]|nr:hypothetical protein HanRHA438_Chr00c42g0857131 [Helianthus annuus]
MGSRLKEDERNERAIRNLLKLPENRRCINCNSLVLISHVHAFFVSHIVFILNYLQFSFAEVCSFYN